MPYQVDDALLHAMSGTELSRVRTELRLLPEPNNQRLLMSRGADIVMQSSPVPVLQVFDNRVNHDLRNPELSFFVETRAQEQAKLAPQQTDFLVDSTNRICCSYYRLAR